MWSARTTCDRIGQGLIVYQDNTPEKTFPLAAVPNPEFPVGERLSWHAAILPDLDHELPANRKWVAVSGGIDHSLAWDDPENAVAANTTVAVFLCPAHPTYEPGTRPAPTHYVGCAGIGEDAAGLPKGNDRAGFFGYSRVVRDADLVAGASNTLVALETTRGNGPWIAAGFPTVRGIPDTEPLIGFHAPFGGCHAGGVNALFADTTVRFVNENIDPKVFRDLARVNRK